MNFQGTTAKIRLVRCPKCKLVLPELPDFDVYKCGGCGATLVAKHRLNIARSTEADLNNSEAVRENQSNRVHDEKEEQYSSNKDVVPCSGECSSCQNDESDQSKDCDGDHPSRGVKLTSGDTNNGNRRSITSSDSDIGGSEISSEVFSPTEFFDDKSEKFGPNGNNAEVVNVGEASFDHRDFSRNEDDELAASEESTGSDEHGNDEFSPSDSEESAHNENGQFAQNENEESNREFVHNDDEDYSQEFDRTENEEFGQEKIVEPLHAENESWALARTVIESAVAEGGLSLVKANTDNTDNRKSDSDSKVDSSDAVNFSSDHMSSRESLVSPRSALKQPQDSPHRGYGRLRSVELDPSYESRGNLGDTSKSPTRSSYAYAGSIFSDDGVDDQFHRFQSHPFEDDDVPTNFFHSEEQTRREKFMVQAMINRDSDVQRQERHAWSDQNSPGLKNSKWDWEPANIDGATRNWRAERQHDHQMGTRGGYENKGPSNQFHDKFQRNSSFQSHLSENPDQMMKLLRMVLEVQNQSSKSGSHYETGPSQKPMYDHHPRYQPNFEDPRDAQFRHPNDPRYLSRYASESNFTNRYRPKKIPFSGDQTSSSHPLDPSCYHCFQKGKSHSEQLPPPSRYNAAAGQCRLHPGCSYCNCYSSAFPPSPQRSVESEYQLRKSQDLTSYPLRERHRMMPKRHFLPVARGAPFVVCDKCCNVLQLPADFLLFKRKCHRLRCGSCSHILKFSLEKGSHIIGYRPKVVDPPPPSLAEDYRHDDNNLRNGDSSTAQTPRGNPVLPFDETAVVSRRQSFSAESDPDQSKPVQTPLGRAFDRIIFGPSYPAEDSSREFVPEPSRGRYKDRPPRHESTRPVSNINKSEVGEHQRPTSPLHRLMGYSSPSQVIHGARSYGIGSSSSFSNHKERY